MVHPDDYDRTAARPPQGDKLAVGTRLGEFEVIGLVGEGGFSVVYLAWDHSLDRKVALKEYMPGTLAMRTGESTVQPRTERQRETFEVGLRSFVNEAKLLAHFDHPALVKVFRFWEANGTAYMVMPFYEGVTLKDAVQTLPAKPSEAWLLGLLYPLTDALIVLHRECCFHRDIAPDNVLLLSQNSKPLLLDFGAARRVIGDKAQALTVILKPGYAPVEQYASDESMKQGPWTDVYALAAVIHWCVTGKTPPVSVGRTLTDIYVPLAQSGLEGYSQRLLEAIDHGLAVLPTMRPQSIEAFRAELGLEAGVEREDSDKTLLWPDPQATVMQPKSTNGDSPAVPTVFELHPTIADAPAHVLAEHGTTPSSAPRYKALALAAGVATTAAVAVLAAWWWSLRTSPTADVTADRSPPAATTSPSTSLPETATSGPSMGPGSTSPRSSMIFPPPARAETAVERLIAQRNLTIDVTASVQLDPRLGGSSAARVSYKASEQGFLYLIRVATGDDRLTLLYPPPGTRPARSPKVGRLEVSGQALGSGGARLLLLLTRERREPSDAEWVSRGRFHEREFGVGLGTVEPDPSLLGKPVCAPTTVGCDGSFGVTEVTQVTNVITSPQTPPLPSPERDEAAAIPPVTPSSDLARPRRNDASSEGKRSAGPSPVVNPECAQILQRMSLGESTPELIERMKTLRCDQ